MSKARVKMWLHEIWLRPNQRRGSDDRASACRAQARRCSYICEDKGLSGAGAKRTALARCLRALRAGDTLIVWKLDRLGRACAI